MKGKRISSWKEIDWKQALADLKALQAELYKALKNNESKSEIWKIHNRMKASFSVRALAVRKVVTGKGGKTSGVDGNIYTTDAQKLSAVRKLKHFNGKTYEASPVKRVWIPKSDGTLRPLGIPTIYDRTVQTLFNFIVDVHQEHTADVRSFGFRIGRSAKQAITYAWLLASGKKRFLMKVDVKKAYDSVSHDWILRNIPIERNVLVQWLKSGVLEKGQLTVDNSGVPQGGPISPTIFNLVMNGIEKVIMAEDKTVFPIRFADDIMLFGNTKEAVEKMKEVIVNFLKPRGMALNEEKTEVAEINKGMDLLGYTIREFEDHTRVGRKGRPDKKGILLIKPSMKAKINFKAKISELFRIHKKSTAYTLILQVNPVIRGWANYFNSGGGWTETKNELGHWLWTKLKQWVYNKHKKLGRRAALGIYFTGVQRRLTYYNKWTFHATKDGKRILLVDIQEILVDIENTLPFGNSPNPYNPEDYDKVDSRLKRQAKNDRRISILKTNLLRKQDGICPACGEIIVLNSEKVERHHIVPKFRGGEDSFKNTELLHKTCHDKKTAFWQEVRANERRKEKLLKAERVVKE